MDHDPLVVRETRGNDCRSLLVEQAFRVLAKARTDARLREALTDSRVMYENGWGVRQDYVIAHMWFNLGATGGDRGAARNRDVVAAKMTAAQVADAERLAGEWEPKSTTR